MTGILVLVGLGLAAFFPGLSHATDELALKVSGKERGAELDSNTVERVMNLNKTFGVNVYFSRDNVITSSSRNLFRKQQVPSDSSKRVNKIKQEETSREAH